MRTHLLLQDACVTAELYGYTRGVGRSEELGGTVIDASVYRESVAGEPLAWPRAHRNALLAATDYAENAGWRTGKPADTLARIGARRQTLRDLPTAYPDPQNVVWPDEVAGGAAAESAPADPASPVALLIDEQANRQYVGAAPQV